MTDQPTVPARKKPGRKSAAEKAAMAAMERPEMREEMRTDARVEDSVTAAATRAKEILTGFDGNVFEGVIGDFDAPPAPPGWTYEFKRMSNLNKEDPSYINALLRTGWTYVPSKRHPEFVGPDYKKPIIEIKGQVLMERPEEITRRFKERDRLNARNQMRAKEEQLAAAPQGQFERSNKDASLVRVNKSYEAVQIPGNKP